MTIQKYQEFIKHSRKKIIEIIKDRIIPGVEDIVEFYSNDLKKWGVYELDMSSHNLNAIKICVELEFEKSEDTDKHHQFLKTIRERIESEFGDDIIFFTQEIQIKHGLRSIYNGVIQYYGLKLS